MFFAFTEKLWTAPELLRLWFQSAECNGAKQQQQLQTQILHGTQKGFPLILLATLTHFAASAPLGDVYSFAIILHEIICRQGPFYLGDDDEKSPRGSVE